MGYLSDSYFLWGIYRLHIYLLIATLHIYMDSKYIKLKDPLGRIALRSLKGLPHKSYELFNELLGMMDNTNALLARHSDLASLCGVSVPTIKKAISLLVELKYIQTNRSGNGCWYSINASIATKCSKSVELYSAGYELWSCKVLVSHGNSPKEFNVPLKHLKEI